MSRTGRCKSCRWWDRSNNFKAIDRDWGACHFWGKRAGFRIANGFIDGWAGHEPRGSDTCGLHNSDPTLREIADVNLAPRIKTEGA
jgi:hypothetical protein